MFKYPFINQFLCKFSVRSGFFIRFWQKHNDLRRWGNWVNVVVSIRSISLISNWCRKYKTKPSQVHSSSVVLFCHTGPDQSDTTWKWYFRCNIIWWQHYVLLWRGRKFIHTSVKIFRIAARIFIFGKLPSGRGSSQFFNKVSTPWSKNSCCSCFLWQSLTTKMDLY